MKTHVIKRGMIRREAEMTFYPLCGMNRGKEVTLAAPGETPTCGRCMILLRDEPENRKEQNEPERGLEDVFNNPVVVHFGADIDMLSPGDSSWCRKKIRFVEESYTTSSEGDVTCKRCQMKLKRQS